MNTCKITQDLLRKYKHSLIDFSKMTEQTIYNVWARDDDYDNKYPLWKHMALKFKPDENDEKVLATTFYKKCDIDNKNILLKYFKMYKQEANELVEFMAWISNLLKPIDILKLNDIDYDNDNDVDINNIDCIKQWKENNIVYFFSLSIDKQNIIINLYNNTHN